MSAAKDRTWMFIKVLFLRLRFVMVFAVVGLLVGNWGLIMNVVDRLTRPAKAEDGVSGDHEYYCPMHPSVVRQDAKEKCPICGMPLSRRKRGEKAQLPAGALARIQLSPHRIQQAGVATEEVGYRSLVREIRTVGEIVLDERRRARISARAPGRIEKLLVDFTGATVKQGEPLALLVSPVLALAQQEYLSAWKWLEEQRAAAKADPVSLARDERLLESAAERLRILGFAEDQIRRLHETGKSERVVEVRSPIGGTVITREVLAGQYVEQGAMLFEVADFSAVWMEAEIFERDSGLVRERQAIEVAAEAWPGEVFPGAVDFVQPVVQRDTRTVRARANVLNPEGKLKPGMFVTATLRIPLGRSAEVFYGC